jgi:hypothetical protein
VGLKFRTPNHYVSRLSLISLKSSPFQNPFPLRARYLITKDQEWEGYENLVREYRLIFNFDLGRLTRLVVNVDVLWRGN